MIPAELLEGIRENGIAYIPIGSMEWHGPHMAMGMDTLNAYEVSLRASSKTGGVVLPPTYIGTETARDPEILKKIGFSGNESIVGMDFPKNTVKSFYWPQELFESIVRHQIEMLRDMRYRLIVLANGHGADNQIVILNRLAQEYSCQRFRVLPVFILFEDGGVGIGHAGLAETAIMLRICPQGVDLGQLPARGQKLYNVDYAIVDNESFISGSTPDFSVRYDPRDATAETGEKLIAHAAVKCAEIVTKALRGID